MAGVSLWSISSFADAGDSHCKYLKLIQTNQGVAAVLNNCDKDLAAPTLAMVAIADSRSDSREPAKMDADTIRNAFLKLPVGTDVFLNVEASGTAEGGGVSVWVNSFKIAKQTKRFESKTGGWGFMSVAEAKKAIAE